MTDPDKKVTPTVDSTWDGKDHSRGGMTLREHFALEFAKAFVRSDFTDAPLSDAVGYADALIAKLNETKKT